MVPDAMLPKMEVVLTPRAKDGHVLESTVNGDIEAFDDYFQKLGNEPLSKSERAIIKTYLHYKLLGPLSGSHASVSGASDTDPSNAR